METKVRLFDYLMSLKETDHKTLLKFFFNELKGKALKEAIDPYRWNYVYDPLKDESKTYPLNETRAEIMKRLKKVEGLPEDFLNTEVEIQLWHIIYSVTDKQEYSKALKSFINKYNKKNDSSVDADSFHDAFIKFPPFKSDYGSYSAKAIKRLLPLMRMGSYWTTEQIDNKTRGRIEKIIDGEYDETIRNRVREKSINLTTLNHFQGLPLWLAQYVVYDRHSEAALAGKWNSVKDLEDYIKDFRQHSLRNPIVEQVVIETLRVVRDIWQYYGAGAENFFDEIHVELGREMKNTAEERKRITNTVSTNEATNQRIKLLITELKANSDGKLSVENVRPHSPTQQEALKLYEEGVLTALDDIPDDIAKISTTAQPSTKELQRYKLWLEQKYRSPYTGAMIPLGRLFTEDYEIEHVIPQSRYFDDSLSNKVICEAAVNSLKDNQLGLEFIQNHGGSTVETGKGNIVSIFTEDQYEDFVKRHYDKNRGKRNKLLLDEIPEKMIERQLNDTRYISKFIGTLLSNIVRDRDKDEGINSKHLLPGNGKITTTLKQDWGLNDVWNELILPRFQRMNELTQSEDFTSTNSKGHVIPTVPLELSKGFNKKRIDHRHHALDALVIACATRDHINLLNNKHAKSRERFDLNRKLRHFKKVRYTNQATGELVEKEVPKSFIKPWPTITVDAQSMLETTVVSFKQNLRVINKTTNKYQSYKDQEGNLRLGADGKPKKGMVKQTKGDSWAIRKSLHTPLPYGKKEYDFQMLDIRENLGKREYLENEELRIKLEELLLESNGKIGDAKKKLKSNPLKDESGNIITQAIFKIPEVRYRKRQPIMKLANRGQGGIKKYEDAVKFINKVANKQLISDLLDHLEANKKDIDLAFSVEGIERFNQNRKIPVYALPISEASTDKFPLGKRKNTRVKFGEADSGTNLYFAIYWDEQNEKRTFETVSYTKAIKHQKKVAALSKNERTPLPENLEKGKFLFHLSPNDLVYIPSNDEDKLPDFEKLTKEQTNRIYKMVSTTQDKLDCVPVHYAFPIVKNEIGSNNKNQNSLDGIQIKAVCIKLQVDRLGNIKPINTK